MRLRAVARDDLLHLGIVLAKRDSVAGAVRIVHRADGEGVLSIRYRSLEQLDDISRRLETGPVAGAAMPSAQQLEMRRRMETEEAEMEAKDAEQEANRGPGIRSL